MYPSREQTSPKRVTEESLKRRTVDKGFRPEFREPIWYKDSLGPTRVGSYCNHWVKSTG